MHDVSADEDLHDHDVEGDPNHGSYESENENGNGGSGQSQFIDGFYYKPVRGSTDGDRLERDLLPLAPGPYYMSYPRDGGSSSHTPKCTEGEWGLVHHTNLGLLNKELLKDPEVCKTVIERVPTPAEQYRMEGLSHRELDDHMTVLLCQLLTHGGELSSRFNRLVGMREHLSDQCREQKRTIQRQDDELAEQAARANEKITKLTSELAALKGISLFIIIVFFDLLLIRSTIHVMRLTFFTRRCI